MASFLFPCQQSGPLTLPRRIAAVVGEKAHTSAFAVTTKKNEYCKTLCRKTYTPQQMEEFQVHPGHA